MKSKESRVTQLQLAEIQQLKSDLSHLEGRSEINQIQGTLRMRWDTLRMQLLRGVEVEPGPIRAYLRKSGNTQKLFVK